jgi:hypothetical protein
MSAGLSITVTPATTGVPYASICSVWKEPVPGDALHQDAGRAVHQNTHRLPESRLHAGKKLSDLVVVAGEDGDTLITLASDDNTQVAIHAGFIVRLPELLVEKTRGALLRCGKIAPAGVVDLEGLKNSADGAVLF